MDTELRSSPFSQEYLVYRGYSYFLLGEDEEDQDKKNNFLEMAILDLRKSMAIGIPDKNKANIFFCIGKIYYYFGEPYYLQALQYLRRSMDAGNKRIDLYYVLGLVLSHLGKYDESVKVFSEALGHEESEIVLLAIANSYYKNNDIENAKKYLNRIMNISTDPKIKEKAFFLFGEIAFKEKNYSEAKDHFDKVVSLNENNASAYFYLGEIYYLQNDIVKARALWRKTLEIDPSHIMALKRIY
jgi:tetratricopeptide (TPR) repeat protein